MDRISTRFCESWREPNRGQLTNPRRHHPYPPSPTRTLSFPILSTKTGAKNSTCSLNLLTASSRCRSSILHDLLQLYYTYPVWGR